MSGLLQLAPGQPRTLAYSQGIRKNLRLLEVADEGMLTELLEGGLCLKGGPGEEAVLCSATKTFAVKNVETTNLVLLVQEETAVCSASGAPAALTSQDPNVQPTVPGAVGLATQLHKNQAAAQRTPVVASALVNSHLELVPAAPRLHRLDALLAEHQYGADQPGDDAMLSSEDPHASLAGAAGGHTEAELLAAVQCSAGELRAALRSRNALCLDGRYCGVDPGFQGMLLELVLLTAAEHGWPLSHLPGAKLAAALEPHGYDPRVTLHCLATHSAPAGSDAAPASQRGGDGDGAEAMDTDAAAEGGAEGAEAAGCSGSGGGVYALDEAAVCLHFARSLLQGQPDWELAAFQDAWERAVPEGMLPNLAMLRGEALRHGGGTGAAGIPQPLRLKHFPLAALPRDAPARFAQLFAERQRWEWEDLEPYVQDLRGPGQTAEALLLKYCRASQARPTDPVTYGAR